MPMYCYRCTRCDRVITELRTIANRDKLGSCVCGYAAQRDITQESVKSMNQEFAKPIEMWSIAPNTPAEYRQLAEAGARFGEQGVPLAHCRAEKLKLLEVVDHVEIK